MFRKLSLLLALLAPAAMALAKDASQSKTDLDTAIADVKSSYTCSQAEEIHFDKNKYKALSIDDRVLVDAQYNKCDLDEQKKSAAAGAGPEPQREVVVFANPVASQSSNKVFYGTVNRKDLENARKACTTGGKAAGIALTIAGASSGVDETGLLGSAVYEYSGVSCSALKKETEQGNAMVLLAPSTVVGHAVAQSLGKQVIDKIPVISDADKRNVEKLVEKATAPPSVSVDDKHVNIKAGPISAHIRKPW